MFEACQSSQIDAGPIKKHNIIMPFEPGNKLSPGRPKGSLNRRNEQLYEKAEELNCDPFEILLLFAKGDWEGLGYTKGTKSIYTEAGIIEEDLISPQDRISAAKEACHYLYSKKKSIEHVTHNALEGMTPEQKLEAMRQAVAMLEGQLNKIGVDR